MKDVYDLSELFASLDKKYPSLGEDRGGKLLQVWHVFASPGMRPEYFDQDPNVQVCSVCGLTVTKAELDIAQQQLLDLYHRNKPVDIHWPSSLLRSLENRLEPVYCHERVPQFMSEVVYRDGIDEPFEDAERSGLTLYGTVDEKTFLRIDAVGLQKGEEQGHLSDAEFNEWFWSLNDPNSDWAKRAHRVLQFVRERVKKRKSTKFIFKNGKVIRSETQGTLKVSDGAGGFYEVPDLRRRIGRISEEHDEGGSHRKTNRSDSSVQEGTYSDDEAPSGGGEDSGDEDVCATCGCFKPCDCPEETDAGTQESYTLECGCDQDSPSLACEAEGVWHVPAVEDDGICDQCGSFKPCEHYPDES